MQRFLLFLLFCFSCLQVIAQQHVQRGNNQWIKFDQDYYKFKIVNDGLYRIYADDLINAGIMVKTQSSPNNPINPDNLQVFGRGTEQYIYLEGVVGGAFATGGFIEFYAKGNDGWFDTQLYNTPLEQPNSHYSLFNDTATYFLTWGSSASTKRASIETDNSFGGYSAAPYFIREVFQQYPYSYIVGPRDAVGSSDPEYQQGEGYASKSWIFMDAGSPFTPYIDNGNVPTFSTPNIFSASPSPYPYSPYQFNTAIVGLTNDLQFPGNDHRATFKINNTTFLDTSFKGFNLQRFSVNIPSSYNSGTNTFQITSNWGSLKPNNDVSTIFYISLRYPHSMDFTGESSGSQWLEVPNNPSKTKSFLSINNFADGGVVPVLWNITTNTRILVEKSGSNLKALVTNSVGNKICYLVAQSQISTIAASAITPVSASKKFINYNITGANSDFVIITHSSLMEGAERYKSYRTLKGSKVLIVDVEELYMQYAYGIHKHPLAIRGFANHIDSVWTSKPAHLFLIGKSISPMELRNPYTITTAGNTFAVQNAVNLVPTIGEPPSDNMLSTRIGSTSFLDPGIPIGRLSAWTNADIDDYLSKVKEYEEAPAAEWMKHAIHLAGGSDDAQVEMFRGFLKVYENKFEDSLYGGNVATFYKNQSQPQISINASLKQLVENGVSMVTFFGHSAATLFDISLEDPKNYYNQGKYSFFLANGCSAGQIHFYEQNKPTVKSSSENYVMIRDKGSIGFLATSSYGVIPPLHSFSTTFYEYLSRTHYGKSIGQLVQLTIREEQPSTQAFNEGTIYTRGVCLEMTLEGDPSIVINSHAKPDIAIDATSIYFNPVEVTTDQTEFTANVIITNIGRTFPDSFEVAIKRRFGDNTDITYRKMVGPVFYKDTVSFILPVDEQRGAGLNLFDVTIDASAAIDEISQKNAQGEMNNSVLGAQLLIKSNDLLPVYPMKYAIVPKPKVTLKAVTGEIFAPERTYLLELDTTDLFNSPLKEVASITQKGGVVSWEPSLTLKDSTVYYWRARGETGTKWKESSFIYIPDKKGWSQAHTFQFKNDGFENTVFNRLQRRVDFVNEVKEFYAYNNRNNPCASGCKINGSEVKSCTWIDKGIVAIIYDPGKDSVWKNPPNPDSPLNRAAVPVNGFEYKTYDAAYRAKFKDSLNRVPNGHYILLYTIGDHAIPSFEPDVKQVLLDMGAKKLDSAKSDVPYIFFTKKGSGIAHEEYGSVAVPALELNDSLIVNWTEGSLSSELIGPAKSWGKIQWRPYSLESPSQDFSRLSLIGINSSGVETVLIPNLTKDSTSLIDISSRISANQYPYLKFNVYLKDVVNRTPPQIGKWQVFYEGVPEISLNPAKYFTFYKDTMEEGDVMRFATAVENISEYNTDSLKMKLVVFDSNRGVHELFYKRRKPLLSSGSANGADTLNIEGTFSSAGFSGQNFVWVEANPDNDQKEQYKFNNIGSLPFYVKQDKSNPLLDVTFDGVHILDGDIVSPKPNIVIKMNDENRYLPINDTSMFNLWILPPGETDMDKNRLFFKNVNSNPNLKFKAASGTKNVAEIEYTPYFPKDGIYSLIAEGVDASNNSSGNKRYKINFEVINKSTITGIFNYPNPFSTSTRFVFTLTGAELPTDFKIQIMTISGKIVREIMLSELGPIRIGRNITQYAWDGKDEFGDQLANGLYIYRVLSRINGTPIEKRATVADKFFVKGYGKMYLIK